MAAVSPGSQGGHTSRAYSQIASAVVEGSWHPLGMGSEGSCTLQMFAQATAASWLLASASDRHAYIIRGGANRLELCLVGAFLGLPTADVDLGAGERISGKV